DGNGRCRGKRRGFDCSGARTDQELRKAQDHQMRRHGLYLATATVLVAGFLAAQGLDPRVLLKPSGAAWPTYNGDYSGKRFSPLTQINEKNVGSLTMAWFYRITSVGAQRGVGNPEIKSTPLMVNGILYFTI